MGQGQRLPPTVVVGPRADEFTTEYSRPGHASSCE